MSKRKQNSNPTSANNKKSKRKNKKEEEEDVASEESEYDDKKNTYQSSEDEEGAASIASEEDIKRSPRMKTVTKKASNAKETKKAAATKVKRSNSNSFQETHKSEEQEPQEVGPVPGAEELLPLLDLDPSPFQCPSDFYNEFYRISYQLMNSYIVRINNRSHRITEVEFYYYTPKHEDIFTHRDELQKTSGQWYFHRSGKGYKGGSYKGLDITFGKDGYGGILIRAIMDIETETYFEGPCNCVNRILELNKTKQGTPEIEDFVEDFDLSVVTRSKLFLQKQDLPALDVCSGPRVGLTLKKTDGDRNYYLMKPYRFMTHPLQVRKGRVNLVLGLYAAGKDNKEIQTLTGCTLATVKKYTSLFDEGKTKKNIEEYVAKTFSTDDLCVLAGLLHVMFLGK